jgi:hypothetical protein
MFTGEMVFPWMFEEFAALQPYKAAADLLADKQDWPQLYRPDVLARNQVGSCSPLLAGYGRQMRRCKGTWGGGDAIQHTVDGTHQPASCTFWSLWPPIIQIDNVGQST